MLSSEVFTDISFVSFESGTKDNTDSSTWSLTTFVSSVVLSKDFGRIISYLEIESNNSTTEGVIIIDWCIWGTTANHTLTLGAIFKASMLLLSGLTNKFTYPTLLGVSVIPNTSICLCGITSKDFTKSSLMQHTSAPPSTKAGIDGSRSTMMFLKDLGWNSLAFITTSLHKSETSVVIALIAGIVFVGRILQQPTFLTGAGEGFCNGQNFIECPFSWHLKHKPNRASLSLLFAFVAGWLPLVTSPTLSRRLGNLWLEYLIGLQSSSCDAIKLGNPQRTIRAILPNLFAIVLTVLQSLTILPTQRHSSFGIHVNIMVWLANFLSLRKRRVMWNVIKYRFCIQRCPPRQCAWPHPYSLYKFEWIPLFDVRAQHQECHSLSPTLLRSKTLSNSLCCL